MVIPGHTLGMKTAISVPDETYQRAARRAGDLGMSRSEFFAAAERYLDQLDAQSLTRQADDALDSPWRTRLRGGQNLGGCTYPRDAAIEEGRIPFRSGVFDEQAR